MNPNIIAKENFCILILTCPGEEMICKSSARCMNTIGEQVKKRII